MKKISYYWDITFFGINMMFFGARMTSNNIGLAVLHGVCSVLLLACLIFKKYEE